MEKAAKAKDRFKIMFWVIIATVILLGVADFLDNHFSISLNESAIINLFLFAITLTRYALLLVLVVSLSASLYFFVGYKLARED